MVNKRHDMGFIIGGSDYDSETQLITRTSYLIIFFLFSVGYPLYRRQWDEKMYEKTTLCREETYNKCLINM